jgi:5-phospho-D-xylono-1,4-lactonase
VIAATGFHKLHYYSDRHWLPSLPEADITSMLVSEINTGIDRRDLACPQVDRSAARAGVIKVATEYQKANATMDKLFAAAAAAHLATGAPIATHTETGTMGHHQLDVLESNGVSPSHVLLGHIDHNPDLYYLTELASRGAYLVFDLPGRTKYAPDSVPLELIAGLVAAGLGARVMLGMDLARRSYWASLGGGPGLAYILDKFVPRLRGHLGDQAVADILTGNPAAALRLAA